MQLLDPLYFVCTLQQNRPTHGDVPRQGDKTCFFTKKCLFSRRLPNKIRKVNAKMVSNFLFFPFLKRSLLSIFSDFLTPVTFWVWSG